jgi:Bacterial SH3 domain
MSLAFISDLSRNLLARTLIATAAVFVFLGFASGALPVSCLTQGLTLCGAVPNVAPNEVPGPDAPSKLQFRFTPPPVKVVAAVPSAPTLTSNEVVAGSFALLKVDLQSAAPTSAASPPTGPTQVADVDPNAPLVRTVKTVSIRADGSPDVGVGAASDAAAMQVAEATPIDTPIAPLVMPQTGTTAVDAADAVATPSAATGPETVDKLALVEEPALPVKKAKPASSGKSATLKGQGANVRSAPSSSASTILFALAGGTKVSIIGSSHGWVQVKDPKGRSGWVYKDYLSL